MGLATWASRSDANCYTFWYVSGWTPCIVSAVTARVIDLCHSRCRLTRKCAGYSNENFLAPRNAVVYPHRAYERSNGCCTLSISTLHLSIFSLSLSLTLSFYLSLSLSMCAGVLDIALLFERVWFLQSVVVKIDVASDVVFFAWQSHSHCVPTNVPGYRWQWWSIVSRTSQLDFDYSLSEHCVFAAVATPSSLIPHLCSFESTVRHVRTILSFRRFRCSSRQIHRPASLLVLRRAIVHYSLAPWYYSVTPLGLIDAVV